MPQSHLGVGELSSILQLILPPALGVVQDLRRQLIDPPLKCGDVAVISKLVEEGGGVEGGGVFEAIYISARSCEHWLDLVQRRLAWLVMFTIGDKDYNFCFVFKGGRCFVLFLFGSRELTNQLLNTSSEKVIFCEKEDKLYVIVFFFANSI